MLFTILWTGYALLACWVLFEQTLARKVPKQLVDKYGDL